jgi:hypothetical protein
MSKFSRANGSKIFYHVGKQFDNYHKTPEMRIKFFSESTRKLAGGAGF